MLKKVLLPILILGVVGFGLIQLLPFGRNLSNPPVVREPAWDSPATRELAQRACFDCHSNEVVWPWYTRLAPASWLMEADVRGARNHFNFSDWYPGDVDIDEIEEVLASGEMPPIQYRLMHKDARLTAAERQQLIDGLAQTLD